MTRSDLDQSLYVCARACVCVRARVSADVFVCVCVRALAHSYVCACTRLHECIHECERARQVTIMFRLCMCVCACARA